MALLLFTLHPVFCDVFAVRLPRLTEVQVHTGSAADVDVPAGAVDIFVTNRKSHMLVQIIQ